MVEDRAYAALVRHALAAEESPVRVVPKRKRPPIKAEPVVISAAAREQYQYEFRELLFRRLDGGMTEDCGGRLVMPDCCARHATLLELGALEMWDLLNRHLYADVPEERKAA